MTSDNANCLCMSTAHLLAQKIFPSIPQESFDPNGDMCFCNFCHATRGDKLIYQRGDPPKNYALPVGWVRLGLQVDKTKTAMNNVWKEWHVAYHGTKKDIIPQIFKAGLHLLKPGDITMDGDELGIHGGHIKQPFIRKNEYTGKSEKFDPNQIYVSPSIIYASHDAYAPSFVFHPSLNQHDAWSIKFAFQLRIKPKQYGIGQETVGATDSCIVLDPHFANNELEWHTKQNIGIVLHGLLLHIEPINTPLRSINIVGNKKCIIDVDKSLVTTEGIGKQMYTSTYAIFQTPWLVMFENDL
eukprot:124207_1